MHLLSGSLLSLKKSLKIYSFLPLQYAMFFLLGLKGKFLFLTHPVKGSHITLNDFFY